MSVDTNRFAVDVPDELVGKTILVTGGAGFIGSHLVDALAPVATVRILDDLSTGSTDRVPDGVTVIEGDIRDLQAVEEAVDGVDVVFHLAANASVERSITAPIASHETNIMGTITVLEAARKADARVVSASSTAIYGAPEQLPVTETDRKEPTSPYGVEKLLLDRDTLLYNDLYGLPTVSLRYFNVYGPGQGANDYSGVITIFLDQARRNVPLTIDGDGSQTRDFVHVRDIVQANLLAAVTDSVGQAFNIGSGDSVTIEDLAKQIIETTGSTADLVYTEPRPGDIPHSRADISKARELLGYEPTVSLETGLETLVE